MSISELVVLPLIPLVKLTAQLRNHRADSRHKAK
jgi:hypothetical protein